MNILIVGGLLLVGVAALVAVVLLFRTENRDTRRRNELAAQDDRLKQETARDTADTLREVTETPGPELPIEQTALQPLSEPEPMQANFNGQFHELVSEIQTLHQDVQGFEQRLSHIASMLDSLEQSTPQRVKIHEESEQPDEK